MIQLPDALAAHLAGDALSLCACWAVLRHDDVVVRGTSHDRDVTIEEGPWAGVYRARSAAFSTATRLTSDGAVSNVDTEGAVRVDAESTDVRVADIEGGLYDQARAVLLLVNWADPDGGQKVLLNGTVGEFYRDNSGRYRAEVRGLTQALSQNLTQTYARMCNVKRFGDERCMFDVESATRTGTVTAVENRRRFTATLDAGPAPGSPVYHWGARLEFSTGANSGYVREVRICDVDDSDDAEILLWDEAPADIEVGDTFSLPPGCDRQYETCRHVHDNLINFRGYGVFASGKDALMRGPEVLGDVFEQPITQAEFLEMLEAVREQGIVLLA